MRLPSEIVFTVYFHFQCHFITRTISIMTFSYFLGCIISLNILLDGSVKIIVSLSRFIYTFLLWI